MSEPGQEAKPEQEAKPVLHMIYDPMCGWCYGATPLVNAVVLSAIDVSLHAGGMYIDEMRIPVSMQWRDHVVPQDLRVSATTGQRFGFPYFAQLLTDTSLTIDSELPTTAILAAHAFNGSSLAMLDALQKAYFVEGRPIFNKDVIIDVAAHSILGPLPIAAFTKVFDDYAGERTRAHIAESRQLMEEVGSTGLPTFFIELQGQKQVINAGPWLGNPTGFMAHVRQQIAKT